jgi:hypothetical protein
MAEAAWELRNGAPLSAVRPNGDRLTASAGDWPLGLEVRAAAQLPVAEDRSWPIVAGWLLRLVGSRRPYADFESLNSRQKW